MVRAGRLVWAKHTMNAPVHHCLEKLQIRPPSKFPPSRVCRRLYCSAFKSRALGVANPEHLPCKEECRVAGLALRALAAQGGSSHRALCGYRISQVPAEDACVGVLSIGPFPDALSMSPPNKLMSQLLSVGLSFSLAGLSPTPGLESAGCTASMGLMVII